MSGLDASAAEARLAGAEFVAAHGDELDARCAERLAGRAEREAVVAACDALRVEAEGDGGATALRILAALDDVRGLGSAPSERAVGILSAIQCDDGAFAIGSPSEDERLFTTGMVAGYLAKTRWVRDTQLVAAGDHLARHWSPERVKGFSWKGIAGHAHCFANVPHDEADAVLQWCGRELERGYRARQFDAARVARVLLLCDAGAVPGAKLDSREIIAALPGDQRGDGGWGDPTTEEVAERVAATLAALAAQARFAPDGSARPAAH